MRAHRVVVFGVAAGLTQLAPAQAAVVHIPTPTLLWFIAGIAIGIVFHEAGHALCAMIARIPNRRVLIGIGPLLLRTRVGDVQLELRLLLLGGAVYYKPPFPPHRLATIFVVLGGILGNFALVGIIVGLGAFATMLSEARAPLVTMAAAQFFLIAVCLLPRQMKRATGVCQVTACSSCNCSGHDFVRGKKRASTLR
jgi:membrane-associated protease RseP (regulator of RpoE activity)